MSRHQSGQAMIAGMVLILAVLFAALFSYQIGRIIKEKSALTIATDAAAFSVAQEHASVLNTLAYLNRAHLAHQIALAHLATMASAEQFRQKQSAQSITQNPPAAVIAMLFGPQHAAAYVASNAGNVGSYALPEKIKQAYRWHDMTVHDLISKTQLQLINSWEKKRNQLFEESLSRNLRHSISSAKLLSLSQLGVSWTVKADETKSKVLMHEGEHAEWLSMLDAVVKTQSYLSNRDYSVRNRWVIHPRCPWRRHLLRRKGSTQLTDRGVWKSEDTLSFHAVRSNKWIGCYMREYPMGWSIINSNPGQSMANEAPRNFSKEVYWKWRMKREGSIKSMRSYGDNRLAHSWSIQDSIQLDGRGQGRYASLHPSIKTEPIAIVFNVKRKLAWIPLMLSATTRSEAYFSDPAPSGAANRLKPSLFMPYWQGRIAGSE